MHVRSRTNRLHEKEKKWIIKSSAVQITAEDEFLLYVQGIVSGGNNAHIGLAYAKGELASVCQSVVELLTKTVPVPGDGHILAAVEEVSGTLSNQIYLQSAVAVQVVRELSHREGRTSSSWPK